MTKNRLVKNNCIPDNQLGFHRGFGTTECLSSFIWNNGIFIKYFAKKIRHQRSVWFCTYPPLYLFTLYIPYSLWNYIYSLFSYNFLYFSSPLSITIIRETYKDFSQVSCHNPILLCNSKSNHLIVFTLICMQMI